MPLTRVLTFACALALFSQPAQAQLFPDKNLEDAVRQQVFAKRNNKQPLVAKDVENISTIKGKGKKIKNLKGLEACRALASLDLGDNEITDLTPLKGLTNLQLLDLSNNKIKDLAPLAELKNLQYLQLENNQVTDISALKDLASLNSLYLSKNQVKDISVLNDKKKLWSLYLGGNPVKALDPIKELTGLQTLDLRETGVSKVDAIEGMNELKYLFLQGNKLTDLSTLLNMAKNDKKREFAPFWRVYLEGNPLSDDGKKQLEELKKMGVRAQS